jgi:hypothetical protein
MLIVKTGTINTSSGHLSTPDHPDSSVTISQASTTADNHIAQLLGDLGEQSNRRVDRRQSNWKNAKCMEQMLYIRHEVP